METQKHGKWPKTATFAYYKNVNIYYILHIAQRYEAFKIPINRDCKIEIIIVPLHPKIKVTRYEYIK